MYALGRLIFILDALRFAGPCSILKHGPLYYFTGCNILQALADMEGKKESRKKSYGGANHSAFVL